MKNLKEYCTRCQKNLCNLGHWRFSVWKAEVPPVLLGQAYELNCSSEIFNSDLGVFSSFFTESHKSLPSLWFSAESHRCCTLYICAQGFCCEKRKTPHKFTVREAEMCQVWSCSHQGLGQQLLHKPRIRPGSSERAELFFPGRCLLLWQCLAQTSKEGLCSALILHLIIPLFTVSRCEEAFHFLEHCCIQTR